MLKINTREKYRYVAVFKKIMTPNSYEYIIFAVN